MADNIQNHADRIVEHFKQALTAQARESLTDSDYKQLNALIRRALSEEREEAVQRVEELARKLRAEVEHPDLSL